MHSGERWRLGHRPALDGLRGVAVTMVVVSHLTLAGQVKQVHILGTAGVTVFFTLSGFLITALLLDERTSTGRASLTAFYIRRARRLLPALLACVAVVSVLGLLVPGAVDYRLVVGALTYSSNWITFHGIGVGTALSHTWSLAIEEQFYIVWPVLLLAGVRWLPRTALFRAAVAVTSLSLLAPFLRWPIMEHVYYSTDSRAFPILLGCTLAIGLHGARDRHVSAVVATSAAVGCVLAPMLLVGTAQGRLILAPDAAAVAAAVAIWGAVHTRAARLLEARTLVLLGQRSYGLYMWHWPVFVTVRHFTSSELILVAVGLPVAWALTLLSWRFVELPFLRKGQPMMPQTPVSGVGVEPAIIAS